VRVYGVYVKRKQAKQVSSAVMLYSWMMIASFFESWPEYQVSLDFSSFPESQDRYFRTVSSLDHHLAL